MSSSALRRIATATATAVAAFAFAASSAQATSPYWSTGLTGFSNTGSGTCKYFDAWNRLDVWAAAPEVFGRNFTAGGANDWQWVRYRSYLVRKSTNTTLAYSNWSEWRQAWDTVKAPFSNRPSFTNVPAGTVIDVRIEWWNQTQMLGAAAHRISPYTYYRGSIGPFGGMDSCAIAY